MGHYSKLSDQSKFHHITKPSLDLEEVFSSWEPILVQSTLFLDSEDGNTTNGSEHSSGITSSSLPFTLVILRLSISLLFQDQNSPFSTTPTPVMNTLNSLTSGLIP